MECPHPTLSLLFLPRRSNYLLMTHPLTGFLVALQFVAHCSPIVDFPLLMDYLPVTKVPFVVDFLSMVDSLVNFPVHLVVAGALLSPGYRSVHKESLAQYALVQPGLRYRLGWVWYTQWKLVEEKPMWEQVGNDFGHQVRRKKHQPLIYWACHEMRNWSQHCSNFA